MRDPHVVSLHYRLDPGARRARVSAFELETPDAPSTARSEPVTYYQPPPIKRDLGPFSFKLADGVLTVTMAEHRADEASARAQVERYLRAWEIRAELDHGPGAMVFRFERAEIVDRNPPAPGESQTLRAELGVYRVRGSPATLTIQRRQYPEPPDDFEVSADVETLWHRYKGYLDGREPLGSMAFFCLDLLERRYDGKQGVAARLGVSRNVVERLGHLATEYGDLRTRRKAVEPSRPATGKERAWLEAVVKLLIRRLGEWSADPEADCPQVTMADLPDLE